MSGFSHAKLAQYDCVDGRLGGLHPPCPCRVGVGKVTRAHPAARPLRAASLGLQSPKKKNGARSVTGDEWEARTLRVVVLLRQSRNPRKNTP